MSDTPLLAALLVGLVAYGVAAATTPIAGRLAGFLGMMDSPSGRKIHAGATPYLGGLGILAGWCVAFLTPGAAAQSVVLIVGMAVLALTGFVDDRLDMSPRKRLYIQFGVAALAYAGGIRMTLFDNVGLESIWVLDLVVTIVWIVGMTNAFNFMDNMDGLAAGVGGIGALALGGLGLIFGQLLVLVLGFALAGSCLGFLRHNFHPARIFMGDTGSLPLGFGLAVLAIKVDFPGVHPLIAFCVPILILGLFVADTTVMAVGRILRREPLIGARLDHISHRMINRDIAVPRVALHMYGVAGILGIIGIAVSQLPPAWSVVAIVATLLSWISCVALVVRWPVIATDTPQSLLDGAEGAAP